MDNGRMEPDPDVALSPWEVYHRALTAARAARARFLAGLLRAFVDRMKVTLCGQARKLNIRLCPPCC